MSHRSLVLVTALASLFGGVQSLVCAAGAASGAAVAVQPQRMAANESAAVAACKTFAEAQDIYRRTDWDKDGILEYAQQIKGNFSLFENKAGDGDIALVDAAFAAAEGSPTQLEDKDIPQADKATEEALAKLVPKLASESYAEREEATAGLVKLGAKAIRPLLKLGEEAKDPEAATRCRTAAAKLTEALRSQKGVAGVTAKPKFGYCYKVLKGQGPNAPGGKKSYVVNGQMTLGYGVLAFPAEYGKTGRNCFQINNTGTVYQRDLGKDTAKIVGSMTAYNPDSNWVVAE